MENEKKYLISRGIKETPNRILVLRELLSSSSPLSLSELDENIGSMDKSSISRVLKLFLKQDLIHDLEGGDGVVKYEICSGEDNCSLDDMHIHFFCQKCHKLFCFEKIRVPVADLPQGFEIRSINYVAKGICEICSKKQ